MFPFLKIYNLRKQSKMNSNTKRGFLNINANECGIAFPVAKQNAETHFRCSQILSEAKEYANAIAHLILGSEELIKALVLFLESKGFDLRKVQGYKKLFHDHKVRHSMIKEFYSVIMFLKSLVHIENKKRHENSMLYYIKAATNVIWGVIASIENYEWWNKADGLKQSCFYVDYDAGIVTPSSITVDEYKQASLHIFELQQDIRVIIVAFSRATEEELAVFRASFAEANFKELIAGTIKRSSKFKE